MLKRYPRGGAETVSPLYNKYSKKLPVVDRQLSVDSEKRDAEFASLTSFWLVEYLDKKIFDYSRPCLQECHTAPAPLR